MFTIVLSTTVGYTSFIAPLPDDDLRVSFKVLTGTVGLESPELPPILGASVDWTANAYGLYEETSSFLNPAPMGRIFDLDLRYLRYPATKLSQDHDWQLGVGKQSERGANPSSGPWPLPTKFGTDEFFRLCNHTNAVPIMVVNANPRGDKPGSAGLAADWVSYCNDPEWLGEGRRRSDNGYREPYGIEYWEIGYEMYNLRYWNRSLTEDSTAGTVYAERVREYSMAMKSVDPNIKVGAWMVLHLDREERLASESWNVDFLNEAAGMFTPAGRTEDRYYYDYVVVKVALPGIEQLLDLETLFTYSYATTYQTLKDDLEQLRGLLATRERVRGEPIPVAIASFEPRFGNEGWNVQAPALAGSAVITATIAKMLVDRTLEGEDRNILYACYSDLNTPSYTSLIINPEFEAAQTDTWDRSPSYFAMQMCSELQGGTRLQTTLKSPEFSVRGEGDLPGAKGVPLVSITATSVEDEVMHLVIINSDLDRTVRCDMDLGEWSGPLELHTERITFESILSDNLASIGVGTKTDSRNTTGPEVTVNAGAASVTHITIYRAGVP